jgi:predicted pPIWI-associating nuclease
MKISVETQRAHLNSVNDELAAVIRNHKSSTSQLIRFATAFSASKANMSWVVTKIFLEIVEMLDNNLDSLNKMHSLLFSIRLRIFFLPIVQIFSKKSLIIPNLEYFSWLLDKVIMNLEKALDEIKSFLLPMVETKDQATQSLVLVLDSPINDIKNSLHIAQNIKELLSKISLANQEKMFSPLGELENTIYSSLLKTIPSAAMTYKQAVMDLADGNRISYRGVANEFRETLRETLDFFAPENIVTSQPNFKFENGKTNSTIKQKVRYILKSRGAVNNALKTPEDAIEIIEDRIASFTRATYERSSISTHIASEKSEVQQIKHYTNAILVELLRIGFDNDVVK